MNNLTRDTRIQPCHVSLGVRLGMFKREAHVARFQCHSFKHVVGRDCHDSHRECWYEGRTTGVCLGASRMGIMYYQVGCAAEL